MKDSEEKRNEGVGAGGKRARELEKEARKLKV